MILDSREHGLKALLPGASSETLPVGDIWIGVSSETASSTSSSSTSSKGLIIERKSVADLEASVVDGRYREQRSRCMAFATERSASFVYIIEGPLEGRRLSTNALTKYLTRLCIRHHIPVLRTNTIEETAELCKVLEDQWTNDPAVFVQPASLSYVETRGATRQANTDDPMVFAVSVLACCRGVSVSIAQELLRAFGSLQGVMASSEGDLAAVKVGKQTFGKVKAERLYRLLHSEVAAAPAPAPAPAKPKPKAKEKSKEKSNAKPKAKEKEKTTITNPMALLED